MKRYFGYIRVSTTKQGEKGSSLQEQKSAIEAYAQRHGLRIVDWYEEQETAAAQGRPVFGRMLKAIDRRAADGVITHKIDRSARNLKDWARIGDLIDRGVEMHFAHESIDLTSRSGRLSADILAVVASDYIRNLRDEVRKGFYGRLKQGLYPLAAPLGYLDQGGGKPKVIDPVQGPLIARAFELYATGLWTLQTLGDELHRRGLRNRRGGRVTQTGLSTILNNPFYTGIIRLRKVNQVFEGVHDPLVDPKLFASVADVLAGRTQKRGPRTRFRYQRMVRCQKCGHVLTGERQKGHVYYRCHTRNCSGACIRQELIDSALLTSAGRLAFAPAHWQAIECDLAKLLVEVAEERPRARAQITMRASAVEERLARLTDAFVDGSVDRETYQARKEQLIVERTSLRSRARGLESGLNSETNQVRRILELAKALSTLVDSLPDDQIREILANTTSNLTATGKNVAIEWREPFIALLDSDPILVGAPDRGDLRTSGIAKIIKDYATERANEEHDLENVCKPFWASPPPDIFDLPPSDVG